MEDVPYVSDEANDLALDWERRFQRISSKAGVLFVSVRPRPASRGKVTDFDVCIGLDKIFPEELGAALGKTVLGDQVTHYTVHFQTFRGVSCTVHHPKAGEDPS